MSSNDQVGHRRMIIDMMPVDTLTKCNCSRSVPSETHRIFQDRHSSQMRKMQDGFTNTKPGKCQKCNRRSALFLLSSSPILTVHVHSLRRSDILRRPALESVSSESRPTFRQNYIKVKAFRNEATLRNRGDLPAVCGAGRASAKKKLALSLFQLCVHDTACS